MDKLKVAELFAGVGGFRLGLENTKEKIFDVTWANQWDCLLYTSDAADE